MPVASNLRPRSHRMSGARYLLTHGSMPVSLLTASKKGMSAHQLHRMIGVQYKTAWFMMHRIREAVKDGGGCLLGGEGKVVQADETYYGNTSKRAKHYKEGHSNKECIVALVEPGCEGAGLSYERTNAKERLSSSRKTRRSEVRAAHRRVTDL